MSDITMVMTAGVSGFSWLGLDWQLIITTALASIPSALITGTALFWATHFNRKIVEGMAKKPKNGEKTSDNH